MSATDLVELARLGLAMGGKDYFTEEEAALYACVSFSQFRAAAAVAAAVRENAA